VAQGIAETPHIILTISGLFRISKTAPLMQLKYKNRLFIGIVVVTNTIGNLLLAIGLGKLPGLTLASMPRYLMAFISNGWILGGIALITIWMLSQLSMYTWADLTYVLPITTSSYIFTALLGKYVLHQQISLTRWAGVLVISLGVLLVSETPLQTRGKLERESGR
jgi:drug/metabolite transporter (DMT)-like permease